MNVCIIQQIHEGMKDTYICIHLLMFVGRAFASYNDYCVCIAKDAGREAGGGFDRVFYYLLNSTKLHSARLYRSKRRVSNYFYYDQ